MQSNSSIRPLISNSIEDTTLSQGIKAWANYLMGAIALLYTPTCCQFTTLNSDHELVDSDGQPIDITQIFEARVFNENYELRWLNTKGGTGQAVLLSESNVDSEQKDSQQYVGTQDQQYLLWGKTTKNQELSDWSTLSTARIGKLLIPLKCDTEGDYIALKTREYFQVVDSYGNVAVVEERLLGLTIIPRSNDMEELHTYQNNNSED